MSDPAVDSLVSRLAKAIADSRAEMRRMARLRRALTLGVIAVMLGYLGAMYLRGQEMYTQANFVPHLQAEAQRLTPMLSQAMMDVARDVGPTYAELCQQQFQEALPRLQETASTEWEGLSGRLTDRAEGDIHATLARVEATHLDRLRVRFPTLVTESGQRLYEERWSRAIEQDTSDVLLHFHERYEGDLLALQTTMEGFRPNEFERMDRDELSRWFVHLWLAILDRHILGLTESPEGSHDE